MGGAGGHAQQVQTRPRVRVSSSVRVSSNAKLFPDNFVQPWTPKNSSTCLCFHVLIRVRFACLSSSGLAHPLMKPVYVFERQEFLKEFFCGVCVGVWRGGVYVETLKHCNTSKRNMSVL